MHLGLGPELVLENSPRRKLHLGKWFEGELDGQTKEERALVLRRFIAGHPPGTQGEAAFIPSSTFPSSSHFFVPIT